MKTGNKIAAIIRTLHMPIVKDLASFGGIYMKTLALLFSFAVSAFSTAAKVDVAVFYTTTDRSGSPYSYYLVNVTAQNQLVCKFLAGGTTPNPSNPIQQSVSIGGICLFEGLLSCVR